MNFEETISKILENELEQYKFQSLNKLTCNQIFSSIFHSLAEVFQRSSAPLGNEAVNYIAQQYYDAILINNNQALDPSIFTQRAKLENVPTNELAFMALLLKESHIRPDIVLEIKRRS